MQFPKFARASSISLGFASGPMTGLMEREVTPREASEPGQSAQHE